MSSVATNVLGLGKGFAPVTAVRVLVLGEHADVLVGMFSASTHAHEDVGMPPAAPVSQRTPMPSTAGTLVHGTLRSIRLSRPVRTRPGPIS